MNLVSVNISYVINRLMEGIQIKEKNENILSILNLFSRRAEIFIEQEKYKFDYFIVDAPSHQIFIEEEKFSKNANLEYLNSLKDILSRKLRKIFIIKNFLDEIEYKSNYIIGHIDFINGGFILSYLLYTRVFSVKDEYNDDVSYITSNVANMKLDIIKCVSIEKEFDFIHDNFIDFSVLVNVQN